MPDQEITLREVTFRPVEGAEGGYEATGRWGTATITLTRPERDGGHPSVTINGLRVPPITSESLSACDIAEPDGDPEGADWDLPALTYVAEVLRQTPVGLFRYLPAAHLANGVAYSLIGGVIDRTGCIVVYYGNWHGETVDRQIDIVFSAPLPHVQSFLETMAEQDKDQMRQTVTDQIARLQDVLALMSETSGT